MFLQKEYEFTLPMGYADAKGNIHRKGVMRLATAEDEIQASHAAGVKRNPDYLPVMLLSRVVLRLEGVKYITPEVIEKLYTSDFAFLQNMYETINHTENPVIQVQCPHCEKVFTDTLNFALGE